MSVLLISLLSSLVWRVDNVDITALWIPDTFQGKIAMPSPGHFPSSHLS